MRGTLNAQANGQVSIGASANWPQLAVTLDFLSPKSSSVTGYTPQFNTFLNVNAAVNAQLTGGASIGVPVVISLFKGRISYSAGVYAEAGVISTLTANLNKSISKTKARELAIQGHGFERMSEFPHVTGTEVFVPADLLPGAPEAREESAALVVRQAGALGDISFAPRRAYVYPVPVSSDPGQCQGVFVDLQT
jgi:hypothetical protein